ncbi:hypothetical protein FA048_19420 [Pedobacter polaris]|uniref:Uncharacterized protein n=1 Tax=Pedobacter polaris TaxID=2571273 RepID=A0A4U1CCS7_9SPHI|nr:hypothetical protein [Pedobacter polaris]TKC04632.1 hypothetical protein FA048_19420 [Pedobacter polaris]
MKKLLIFVMACYGLNARSQENESKNFLYLYSDSTIYAQKIRLRPDFNGSWTLRADSRRIPVQQVKFFNNEDGFFANTKKLQFYGETSFAERIISGKVNLYQEVVYNPIAFEADYYRFKDRKYQSVGAKMYYNKGISDMKKINYKNLSLDMADNAQSLDLLKSYRKSKRTGIIMYVAAGAAIVAGTIKILTENNVGDANFSVNGNNSSFILWGLGGGLVAGGYFIEKSGYRNIERAIETYNRK